jgi:uncharacterized protein (DUF1778 family)
MATRTRAKEEDDTEGWEVIEAPTRPLGTAVSVRFDSDAARAVRQAASAMGLTLSEFVRRAALVAASDPSLLARVVPPNTRLYQVISGPPAKKGWWPPGANSEAAR